MRQRWLLTGDCNLPVSSQMSNVTHYRARATALAHDEKLAARAPVHALVGRRPSPLIHLDVVEPAAIVASKQRRLRTLRMVCRPRPCRAAPPRRRPPSRLFASGLAPLVNSPVLRLGCGCEMRCGGSAGAVLVAIGVALVAVRVATRK